MHCFFVLPSNLEKSFSLKVSRQEHRTRNLFSTSSFKPYVTLGKPFFFPRYYFLHLKNNDEIRRHVSRVLAEIPDLQKRKKQLAGKLSGGERKLLSLAMVLANHPKLLLYDEPLAGLSEENIPMVLNWLDRIHQDGATMVIIEHRIKELMNFATRVVGLKLGDLKIDDLYTLGNIKKYMV